MTRAWDIDLQKTKAKDFYWLLNKQVNYLFPTSPKKWSNIMNLNSRAWQHIFNVATQICRENKLKEFIIDSYIELYIVIRKELCCFGIKQDSDCLYCEVSMEHAFIKCQFLEAFQRRII